VDQQAKKTGRDVAVDAHLIGDRDQSPALGGWGSLIMASVKWTWLA